MFIQQHKKEFSIQAMCKVLAVSRAGFYAWSKRPESLREREDKKLVDLIKISFHRSRQTYGYRRIHADLKQLQYACSRDRAARLMRENSLIPKMRKRFKATTNSKHTKPVAANYLARQFTANAINERWVSDITYVATNEGWLYLAVVMDLYSRKIIGWSMSSRMQESLVIDALQMALFRRKIKLGLLLHSDRGSQYASDNYQRLLIKNTIQCSMSRKGNCWDNSVMESFFHSLKVECVYMEKYQTRDEARNSIFDYIEVFYNRQRRHSFLGYVSPNQYEMKAC